MGFLTQEDLPEYEDYDLVKDESNPDEIIYWSSESMVQPETINYVLQANGYATDTLHPVTTQKYGEDENFELYSAPRPFHDIGEEAKNEDYIYLPLVFRYEDILADETTYVGNENIYLSRFKLNTFDEDTYIHKAVRIYTSSKSGNTHLINPSVNEDGTTDVGGVLDLNRDGFYDSFELTGDKYEHVYGQTTESSYKENPESEDTVIPKEERNSFVAGHKSGTYALESCVPEVAQYEGFYGFRNRHKWVTTTNPDAKKYAYLDLSIFIEGWDLNVIDSQKGMPFSIELTFDTSL